MKRPVFLTIWLILIALGSLYTLYSYTLGTPRISSALPNFPSWTPILYDVLAVTELISVVLLWIWKKLGFYLIIGATIVSSVFNIVILGAPALIGGIVAALGVVILYSAMRPVWKNFT